MRSDVSSRLLSIHLHIPRTSCGRLLDITFDDSLAVGVVGVVARVAGRKELAHLLVADGEVVADRVPVVDETGVEYLKLGAERGAGARRPAQAAEADCVVVVMGDAAAGR